jgi:AcrR family transcriptional regulator
VRETSREELIEAARRIFRSKGYKETNVADVTQRVGIAVGSFYKFFDSKEDLFVEVYGKENAELKERLFAEVDPDDDPVTLATTLVSRNAVEMNANPILREWYNTRLMARLEGHFQKRGFGSVRDMLDGGITSAVVRWQTAGRIRTDMDAGLIVAIFRAIPYIDLHKREIGPEHFPEILSSMTELIMRGLSSSQQRQGETQ